MVWVAVTKSGRSPFVFVEQGVKLKQENYRNDILVDSFLPWAKQHFKKRPWTFQQDSAPSHKLNRRRSGYQPMSPTSFPKRNGPLSSPDLNPLDFGIWGYLESKVSATNHKSLETLKTKLRKEWSKMPQDVIRDSCRSFSRRFQTLGGHF